MKEIIHSNNFNFLRLIFASLVIFSHSFALLGHEEPILWGRSIGNLSVHGFFVISGYLICQSYVKNPNLISFTANRLLRLIPGLVCALIITNLIAKYCNEFSDNPVKYNANGSIWTLTWEVVCYAIVAIAGILTCLNRNIISSVSICSILIYIINTGSTSGSYLIISPIFLMFLIGSFIYFNEKYLDVSVFYVSAFLLIAMIYPNFFNAAIDAIKVKVGFLWGPKYTTDETYRIFYTLCFPFFVIFIGKFTRFKIPINTDISYGIYIYGWPIAQAIIFVAMSQKIILTPLILFALTILISTPIAILSWKLIEKPSLSCKKYFKSRNYQHGVI